MGEFAWAGLEAGTPRREACRRRRDRREWRIFLLDQGLSSAVISAYFGWPCPHPTPHRGSGRAFGCRQFGAVSATDHMVRIEERCVRVALAAAAAVCRWRLYFSIKVVVLTVVSSWPMPRCGWSLFVAPSLVFPSVRALGRRCDALRNSIIFGRSRMSALRPT